VLYHQPKQKSEIKPIILTKGAEFGNKTLMGGGLETITELVPRRIDVAGLFIDSFGTQGLFLNK
jgi:hypothetical protein